MLDDFIPLPHPDVFLPPVSYTTRFGPRPDVLLSLVLEPIGQVLGRIDVYAPFECDFTDTG